LRVQFSPALKAADSKFSARTAEAEKYLVLFAYFSNLIALFPPRGKNIWRDEAPSEDSVHTV
jgi:hypothetical protein